MLERVIPVFSITRSLNTLVFGGNSKDSRDYAPFQTHYKQLYSTQDSTAYANRLWKAMVKGKARGITADVFFLVLLKLDLEQEKTRRELFYLLEKYSILQKMVLWLVFGLEKYLQDIVAKPSTAILHPTDINANIGNREKSIDDGVSLLRSKFTNRIHPFALNFFLHCPKTLGYLSSELLREAALQDYRIAQIIFADKILGKKLLLKFFLTQNDLITLIANAPPLDSKLVNTFSELLFGIPLNNDYLSELFEIIFNDPILLAILLNSSLLTQAARQENAADTQYQRAIERIREYFYAGYLNPHLVSYLKKQPEVFIQLAGTEGQRIVDLLGLTDNPLELLKFFAPIKLFQNTFQRHIGKIALRIIEQFPQYTNRLLKIKVGIETIREHLRNELIYNYLQNDQAISQFHARFKLRHKLKLSIEDYERLLAKPYSGIELVIALDNKLWKMYKRIYKKPPSALMKNRPFLEARYTLEQSSSTKVPESMSLAKSLVVASIPNRWKKISSPRWREKPAVFAERLGKLQTNPIFAARLQLGRNKKLVTWQEIVRQVITNCKNDPHFFDYNDYEALKNLICNFTTASDLWTLAKLHPTLQIFASARYSDKLTRSTFDRLSTESINRKSPEYMQMVRDLVALNRDTVTEKLFSGEFDLNLENLDNVCHLSKQNTLFWESVAANEVLIERFGTSLLDKFLADNTKSQEYMQTIRDLVALNNDAITTKLFSGKVDLNLENFDNVRQLSKENLLFWENVVTNNELREKIAPETWVKIMAHNPAAQRGVLKKSPSGFINTLKTVFKAKINYEFLFATNPATMFSAPKSPEKPRCAAADTPTSPQPRTNALTV